MQNKFNKVKAHKEIARGFDFGGPCLSVPDMAMPANRGNPHGRLDCGSFGSKIFLIASGIFRPVLSL
jgi:hypothetical protein